MHGGCEVAGEARREDRRGGGADREGAGAAGRHGHRGQAAGRCAVVPGRGVFTTTTRPTFNLLLLRARMI